MIKTINQTCQNFRSPLANKKKLLDCKQHFEKNNGFLWLYLDILQGTLLPPLTKPTLYWSFLAFFLSRHLRRDRTSGSYWWPWGKLLARRGGSCWPTGHPNEIGYTLLNQSLFSIQIFEFSPQKRVKRHPLLTCCVCFFWNCHWNPCQVIVCCNEFQVFKLGYHGS